MQLHREQSPEQTPGLNFLTVFLHLVICLFYIHDYMAADIIIKYGLYEILAAMAILRDSSVSWAVDANPLARLSCSLELPFQHASLWAGGNPFNRGLELQNSEVRESRLVILEFWNVVIFKLIS